MPDIARPRGPAPSTADPARAHSPAQRNAPDTTAPQSREERLLDLQRTIGNRAIEALVGPGEGPDTPIVLPEAAPTRWPSSVLQHAGMGPTAQRSAATAVQRRGNRQGSVADQVKELMSYGLLDWAITDNDALRALGLLSNVPTDQLPGVVNSIGAKYLRRLLDNLPASGRRTPTFTRLLVAMGPASIIQHVEDLLSYGVFDWMITESEARQAAYIVIAFLGRNTARAVEILTALPHDAQDIVIARLQRTGHLATLARTGTPEIHQNYLQPLVARYGSGGAMTAQQRTNTKTIFDASPNSQLETLKTCMSQRFALAIGGAQTAAAAGETAIDWEPLGLRRMYPVLEALPQAHVAQNARMLSMGRYQGTGVGGYYWRNEAAIGYDVPGLGDTQSSDAGDPLVGVNRFDKVVRHEVGHAVDAQMGWSDGAGAQASNRGGWRKYGGATQTVVDLMVADANDAIAGLADPHKRRIVRVIKRAMDNRNSNLAQLRTAVQGIAGWGDLDADVQTAVLADPVLQAVSVALRNPWYRHAQGGVALDGKVYQESYANNWTRYEQSARARKVSQYQFRAPGEWFAEAYAAYYEPNRVRGALLAQRDPNSKAWFDREVHTLAASR